MYSGEGEKDEQERRRGGRLVLVEKCWLASFLDSVETLASSGIIVQQSDN